MIRIDPVAVRTAAEPEVMQRKCLLGRVPDSLSWQDLAVVVTGDAREVCLGRGIR